MAEPSDKTAKNGYESDAVVEAFGRPSPEALALIREMIVLPLRQPALFATLGVSPPRGLLLYDKGYDQWGEDLWRSDQCGTVVRRDGFAGDPALLFSAIANENGASFVLVNGLEIASMTSDEAEARLSRAFEEAKQSDPAIIFISELGAMAPKRGHANGEVETRIASQLSSLMDGLDGSSRVVLIGAANRPNTIDTALIRFGCFDRELHFSYRALQVGGFQDYHEFVNRPARYPDDTFNFCRIYTENSHFDRKLANGAPDVKDRCDILRAHTKNMKLTPDVRLKDISVATHGFVGADLAQLCMEAAIMCIREKVYLIKWEEGTIGDEILDAMAVSQENFTSAIGSCNPFLLREIAVNAESGVRWDDIGGLEQTKRRLWESVCEPFLRQPARRLLLWGPPGCGKSLLARATAQECCANLVSVNGITLRTMCFGQSEENVRALFAKARRAAPCILFVDELEGIGWSPRPGLGRVDDEGASRVFSQLLAEIGGANSNITFIGSTSKVEFFSLESPATELESEPCIYIPMPDLSGRRSILEFFFKKLPLAPNVPLIFIAQLTCGWTGAQLVEMCQSAANAFSRDRISANEVRDTMDEELVCEIGRKHFEQALAGGRHIQSQIDLTKYDATLKQFLRTDPGSCLDVPEEPVVEDPHVKQCLQRTWNSLPACTSDGFQGGFSFIKWPSDSRSTLTHAVDDDDDLYD